MAKWKDFFAMKRHERVGALVVLVLILVAVLAQWLVPRCTHEATPPLNDEQLERFERETDTALVVERERTSSHRHHRRDTTRSRKHRSSSKQTSSRKSSSAPASINQRNDIVENEADRE